MMEEEKFYGSEKKRYSITKAIGLFPKIFGEGGISGVLLYGYFRWADDILDGFEITHEEKLVFLNRQRKLLQGESIDNLELKEQELKESKLFEEDGTIEDSLLQWILLLLNTMGTDLLHSELNPRTDDKLTEYHQNILLSCIQVMSLLINEKSFESTDDFLAMLYHWNMIGSLDDIDEDLQAKIIQIPLQEAELKKLEDMPLEERESYFKDIFTKERFEELKKISLSGLGKYKKSFFSLSMPLWQQVISYLYISRVQIKYFFRLKHPYS